MPQYFIADFSSNNMQECEEVCSSHIYLVLTKCRIHEVLTKELLKHHYHLHDQAYLLLYARDYNYYS